MLMQTCHHFANSQEHVRNKQRYNKMLKDCWAKIGHSRSHLDVLPRYENPILNIRTIWLYSQLSSSHIFTYIFTEIFPIHWLINGALPIGPLMEKALSGGRLTTEGSKRTPEYAGRSGRRRRSIPRSPSMLGAGVLDGLLGAGIIPLLWENMGMIQLW